MPRTGARLPGPLTQGAAPKASARRRPHPGASQADVGTQAHRFRARVLLLCAGCELEGRFGEGACAALNNDRRVPASTIPDVAFSVLPKAHWAARGPRSSLAAWLSRALGRKRYYMISVGLFTATSLRADSTQPQFSRDLPCLAGDWGWRAGSRGAGDSGGYVSRQQTGRRFCTLQRGHRHRTGYRAAVGRMDHG